MFLVLPDLFLSMKKVDAAEALSCGGGGGRGSDPSGDGVEPRLASLETHGDINEGSVSETGLHNCPSSTVVRDSGARAGPTTSRLGREAAASLLQSRFRRYRTRKGWIGGGVGGRGGVDGLNAEGGGSGGVSSGKCSLLELEVGSTFEGQKKARKLRRCTRCHLIMPAEHQSLHPTTPL